MRIILLILTFSFLFFGVGLVFAVDAPQLSSPSNSSTVTSSSLNWQSPSYPLYVSNPYRVQVDDDANFSPSSSIFRDTYKDSTTYTPVLTNGIWYWRVKVRDTTGTWSDWSSAWSFTLSDTVSSPTPTPSATASPSTPSPTSSSSPTSFTISNSPTKINSDQSFSVLINLSLPSNPNATFYLKGAFKKTDGSNYFGQTNVSNGWVKNGSSYSNQFPVTTDSSGNWSGNLEIQPDTSDSGFVGSGNYNFKVGRYNSSGSGPTWSNEVSVSMESVAQTTEQSSAKTNEYTSNETATPNPSVSSKTTVSKSPVAKYRIATVVGASFSASPSGAPEKNIEIKNQKQINLPLVVGILLVFAGASSLGYIYLNRIRK